MEVPFVYHSITDDSSNIAALANNKRIQQTKMKQGFLIAITIVFLILNAIFFLLDQQAPGFDTIALYSGNVIMALVSIASYFLVTQQLNSRPQAFVRGVYTSTYLKLFVCVASVLIYVLIKRPNVHKASIFVLLGIYAVYTIVETIFVSKKARKTT